MWWVLLIIALIVIFLVINYWYIAFTIGAVILVIYFITKADNEKKRREAWERLQVTDPSSINRVISFWVCPKCPRDSVNNLVYFKKGPEGKAVGYHNLCGYYEVRNDLEWDSLVNGYIKAGAIRYYSEDTIILTSDLKPNEITEVVTKEMKR